MNFYFLITFILGTISISIGLFFIRASKIKSMGFLSITPLGHETFFEISEDITNMEPVVNALCDENTKVYSNLAKILLSEKSNSIVIEDKNFKNSILVNRRRSRKTLLYHGDIIDMGELTLMFIHPNQKPRLHYIPSHYKTQHLVRNQRASGKILNTTPTLIPTDHRRKTFYLTKNITFIGRSDTNDLVTKTKSVSLKHAKVERISGKHKLIDINSKYGTFVNGKRIEEKYLKHGDEISFEAVRYHFSENGKFK